MARSLTKEQNISNVYDDTEGGFGSIQETYETAKQQNPEITLDEVKDFMRKQPNKQVKGYRCTNSYIAPLARFEFQFDIMVMAPLSKKPEVKCETSKTEPKHALVVIDIFSKYADLMPTKEK